MIGRVGSFNLLLRPCEGLTFAQARPSKRSDKLKTNGCDFTGPNQQVQTTQRKSLRLPPGWWRMGLLPPNGLHTGPMHNAGMMSGLPNQRGTLFSCFARIHERHR